MKRLLLTLSTLLFALSIHAQSRPGTSQKGFNSNRRFSFKQNPFTTNCEGAKKLPTISTPRLRVDADEQTGLYLITFQFRTNERVFLKLSEGRLQGLARTRGNIFNLSLSRQATDGSIRLGLVLGVGDDAIEYQLAADANGTGATLTPVLSWKQYQNICLRNQIWAGLGSSMFLYDQSIPARSASAEFSSFTDGSFHIEGRWYPKTWLGLVASYKNAPGEVDKGKVSNVEQTNFNWKILELAGQFRKPEWLIEKSGLLIYPYIRTGLQQHWKQRIGIDDSANVFFQDYKITDLAIGGGANIFTKNHYFFEVYLNYKYPLKEANVSISPNLMFDGGIGGGAQLSKDLVWGVFWYGHWDQYDYSSESARDPSSGDVKFIFSNFDIRLGYLF